MTGAVVAVHVASLLAHLKAQGHGLRTEALQELGALSGIH